MFVDASTHANEEIPVKRGCIDRKTSMQARVLPINYTLLLLTKNKEKILEKGLVNYFTTIINNYFTLMIILMTKGRRHGGIT